MTNKKIIYLDYNATTPCAPEVVEAILPFFQTHFANASSAHSMGRRAAQAVERARRQVAILIGCSAEDLRFTSGATESNNLVLLGLLYRRYSKRRIVVSAIEHKSVLEPCRRLSEQGFEVIEIPVTRDGIIDIHASEQLINTDTLLVSVHGANNEIGTLQPIRVLADICHANNALLHCDATQMLGKLPVSVVDMDVDFASFSSHKTYGPKGIGVLYLKPGPASTVIEPLILGGGQESGARPGTLNVPAIVGFGEACQIACDWVHRDMLRIKLLRESLEQQMLEQISDSFVIAASAERLPGTSSIFIKDVAADALIARTPLVCVGMGSACTSGAPSPSHVLLGCGYSRDTARCVIRISQGRYTTEEEVNLAVRYLVESVNAIREYGAQELDGPVLSRIYTQ